MPSSPNLSYMRNTSSTILIESGVSAPHVHMREYKTLDGSKKLLIERVEDGSIIKRFDLTPFPKKAEDIVCPHFLELKWALGCKFNCAWCYLKGTLRYYPERTKPRYKDPEKIRYHVKLLFSANYREREVLNTGEVADSFISEDAGMPRINIPFSKFIIPLFEAQDRHKVLFLTKAPYVKNLLEISPHKQSIISFSLNAIPVAEKWEHAPPVIHRIEAARQVFEAGYETRVRIDPIVPIPNWKMHYVSLIDQIFQKIFPERVTLGSLRGLQSTINEAEDRTWVDYLTEPSKWGKRVSFKLRQETFQFLIDYLEKEYDYTKVAICKEPCMMWESLGMDWAKCRCNCVW